MVNENETEAQPANGTNTPEDHDPVNHTNCNRAHPLFQPDILRAVSLNTIKIENGELKTDLDGVVTSLLDENGSKAYLADQSTNDFHPLIAQELQKKIGFRKCPLGRYDVLCAIRQHTRRAEGENAIILDMTAMINEMAATGRPLDFGRMSPSVWPDALTDEMANRITMCQSVYAGCEDGDENGMENPVEIPGPPAIPARPPRPPTVGNDTACVNNNNN